MAGSTDSDIAIAADVGGTNLRVGLVDRAGSIERLSVSPTPTGDDRIIDELVTRIGAVRATVGANGTNGVVGVGIGLPGRLDDHEETWSLALNLGVSSPVALRSRLESALGEPLMIGNDVRLSTLGAARHFAGIGRVAYLSVGTGVAGGALSRSPDGDLAPDGGFVGEIGHITVPGLDTVCLCGQVGCVESAAGGGAMLRRWRASGGAPADDVSTLWDAADDGHFGAVSIRDDCVSALAWTVQLYAVAFGADAVVIGGGVSRLGSQLHAALTTRLGEVERSSSLMASFGLAERVLMSPATAEFGLLGAAHLVFGDGRRL